MLEVAHDIAAIFSLPESKIVHVRDRAFNDRRYYICDQKLAALGDHTRCKRSLSLLRVPLRKMLISGLAWANSLTVRTVRRPLQTVLHGTREQKCWLARANPGRAAGAWTHKQGPTIAGHGHSCVIPFNLHSQAGASARPGRAACGRRWTGTSPTASRTTGTRPTWRPRWSRTPSSTRRCCSRSARRRSRGPAPAPGGRRGMGGWVGGVPGWTRRPGALLALNLPALSRACPREAALAGICRVLRGWPVSSMLYAHFWLCV